MNIKSNLDRKYHTFQMRKLKPFTIMIICGFYYGDHQHRFYSDKVIDGKRLFLIANHKPSGKLYTLIG